MFLLDLKPDENRFLSIRAAIEILLKIAKKKDSKIFSENSLCIGCARLGSENSIIKSGKARELLTFDFGKPPYCLVVPARLNHKEEEYLESGKQALKSGISK